MGESSKILRDSGLRSQSIRQIYDKAGRIMNNVGIRRQRQIMETANRYAANIREALGNNFNENTPVPQNVYMRKRADNPDWQDTVLEWARNAKAPESYKKTKRTFMGLPTYYDMNEPGRQKLYRLASGHAIFRRDLD